MGSCASNRTSNAHRIEDIQLKPSWTLAVEVKPNYLKDKISPFSPGFRAINNNTVELTGGGKDKVEGAQWSRGFTSGKHVIEFIFPIHLRTVHSRVGLAPEGTKLGGNDLKRVVGGRGSWAIDLKASALFQNGKNIGSFPSQRKTLPDWFFMYIDLETGTMQFGSDTEFFGTAFMGIQSDRPLYPMVTASGKGAIVGIVYRGKGKEIEGPLRKNRTLAAVRRSERARQKERDDEKHRKQSVDIPRISSGLSVRKHTSSPKPVCSRMDKDAVINTNNNLGPLHKNHTLATIPRNDRVRHRGSVCGERIKQATSSLRISSGGSVQMPTFAGSESGGCKRKDVDMFRTESNNLGPLHKNQDLSTLHRSKRAKRGGWVCDEQKELSTDSLRISNGPSVQNHKFNPKPGYKRDALKTEVNNLQQAFTSRQTTV